MIERSLHACGSGSTRLHVRVLTAWTGGHNIQPIPKLAYLQPVAST